MDPKITEQLKDFVYADEEKRDYSHGAMLLLKVSGNRVEYNNNMARLQEKKAHILRRLRQNLEFRLSAITKEQVKELSVKADKIVNDIPKTEEKFKSGKRADHDDLPEEIQALYKEARIILQKQQQLHLKIRTLALADAPCPESELFPFVNEIVNLDKQRLEKWKKYDEFGKEPVETESKKPKKGKK